MINLCLRMIFERIYELHIVCVFGESCKCEILGNYVILKCWWIDTEGLGIMNEIECLMEWMLACCCDVCVRKVYFILNVCLGKVVKVRWCVILSFNDDWNVLNYLFGWINC
jgi:hypothetical protein